MTPNKSCTFYIDVGSGAIELTLVNVSLPDDSRIHTSVWHILVVGKHFISSRVIYIHRSTTLVAIRFSDTSTNDIYRGVKLRYRRISNDVCRYSYMPGEFYATTIKSPGYPNNYPVNSTCQYAVEALSRGWYQELYVLHIAFLDMSFGPNDVFTIYDAKDNSIILGPIIGPQDKIRTKPTNSSYVKIVVVANNTSSSSTRRYAFIFKVVPRGTCQEDYYGKAGVVVPVSSAGKRCRYIFRAEPNAWGRLWIQSIQISSLHVMTVTVKSLSDKTVKYYYFSSTFPMLEKNFDGLNQGNLIEIYKSDKVVFDLKFMAYTNYSCPFYEISEDIEKDISTLGYPGNLPRNSSCEYYIRSKNQTGVVYIRFSELFLSSGDDLTIYDASDDSVLARYDEIENALVSVMSNSPSVRVVFTTADTEQTVGRRFKLYHKILFSDRTIKLNDPNGTLLSPYYPNSYLIYSFEYITIVYHVQVPYGHPKLNFTELNLAEKGLLIYPDLLEVYDGNTTSAKKIGSFTGGEQEKLPAAFFGSDKYLTVKFVSRSGYNMSWDKLYHFKAEYTTETQVTYCKAIEWPHSHAETNLTVQGHTTKFFCDKDYVRANDEKYITLKCSDNGEWDVGTLKCLRICPRLDGRLKDHSSLSWDYSSGNGEIHEGVYVNFSCFYHKQELQGPDTIMCTSYGNYSALPPICKQNPEGDHEESSDNSWKYGVGFGVAALMIVIVIVALRIHFGRFICCTGSSGSSSMQLSNVQYSKT